MKVNRLIEINIQGKHYTPGRGVTFVADNRENEFNLTDLKPGDSVVIQQKVWIICSIECFSMGRRKVAPVMGLVVRKELN
tara:strand:- start:2125 stop:2364 length:240 start_codon:yes stop_codon:yes gene_type:complete